MPRDEIGPSDSESFVRFVPSSALVDGSREAQGLDFGPYAIESVRRTEDTVVLLAKRRRHWRQRVVIRLVPMSDGRGRELRAIRERDALCKLDHPNIIRVLDYGTTTGGDAYTVFEHVAGKDMCSFCDMMRAGIGERLTLFRRICTVIQYVHQHSVIHGNLKPANLLITTDGEPMLIGFDAARSLDPSAWGEVAEPAETICTPNYASPEQLRGEPLGVQSDIFSLGVVLCELVTGCIPFGQKSYDGAMPGSSSGYRGTSGHRPRGDKMLPSELVVATASHSDEPVSIAFRRRETVAGLSRKLRGDIDFIITKALRNEPRFRYLSAGEMAADIRCYQEIRPISELSADPIYRLRKFARRNQNAVVASAVCLGVGAASAWAGTLGNTFPPNALAPSGLGSANRPNAFWLEPTWRLIGIEPAMPVNGDESPSVLISDLVSALNQDELCQELNFVGPSGHTGAPGTLTIRHKPSGLEWRLLFLDKRTKDSGSHEIVLQAIIPEWSVGNAPDYTRQNFERAWDCIRDVVDGALEKAVSSLREANAAWKHVRVLGVKKQLPEVH